MKKLLLATTLSILSLSSFAQEEFLSGFANACQQSKSYQNFQKNLCKTSFDKDNNEHCTLGRISLPKPVNSLVLSHKLTNNFDSTLFEIKLKPGLEYAHNKIIGIEQWSGHSNGIWGTALVTDDHSEKSVNQKIKQSGIKIKVLKDTHIGDISMVVAKGDDGFVRLICDTSN